MRLCLFVAYLILSGAFTLGWVIAGLLWIGRAHDNT